MRGPRLNLPVVSALSCAILIGLVFPGCRSSPSNRREIALMRAEILDLEDQYYSMKSRFESANAELQDYRGKPFSSPTGDYIEGPCVDGNCYSDNATLNGEYIPHAADSLRYMTRNLFRRNNMQLQQAQPQTRTMRRQGLLGGLAPGLFRRNRAINDYSTDMITDFDIVIPENDDAGSLANHQIPSSNSPSIVAPLIDRGDNPNSNVSAKKTYQQTFDTNPLDFDLGDDPADNPSVRRTDQRQVTQVYVNPDATHGEDVDGQPGHEGLVLLIQPKDQHGQVVNEAGEVTISLIEPSSDGAEQRIGLWKFTPEEVRLFAVKDKQHQQGYLLHLPWENNIPKTNELLLYVRYWTVDGRRLETSVPLSIDPPNSDYATDGPFIEGWTKRDPRSNRGTGTPDIPSQQSMLADDSNASDQNSATEPSQNRRLKATPASSTIKSPAWRPVR